MVITSLFIIFVLDSSYLNFFFFFIGARRPYLSRFYIKWVRKARLYTNRTFHFLFSLQRLATWGLGPEPSVEAIAHKLTIRRCKFSYHRFPFPFSLSFSFLFLFFFFFLIMSFFFRNGYNERKQGQRSGRRGNWAGGVSTSSSARWQKKKLVLGGWLREPPKQA